MKTILVATDFSPAAANAAHYAADMATAINARLILLHTVSLPVSYTEMPVAVTIPDLMREAEASIRNIKDHLFGRANYKIRIDTLVKEGSFFAELSSLCTQVTPYVVIMGSQGNTQAERIFYGGHTLYAMKNLQWPLLTVPRGCRFSGIRKIGLACDFDSVVDTVPTDEIKLLVNDFGAKLHILNTGKVSEFDPDIVFQSGLLHEMIGELKPEFHFISDSDTDRGILDFVEENEIDLLLVIPKRRRLLQNLLHKSHTRNFVLHCHVPVMALH